MKTFYTAIAIFCFLVAWLLAVRNGKSQPKHATPDSYQLSEREGKR